MRSTVGLLALLCHCLCNGSYPKAFDSECEAEKYQGNSICKRCGINQDMSVFIPGADFLRLLEKDLSCLIQLCTDGNNTWKSTDKIKTFNTELYKEGQTWNSKLSIRHLLRYLKPHHGLQWHIVKLNSSKVEVVIYLYCDKLKDYDFTKPTNQSFLPQSFVEVKGCCVCRMINDSSNGKLTSGKSKSAIIFGTIGGIVAIFIVCAVCHYCRERPNAAGWESSKESTDSWHSAKEHASCD